LKQDQAVAYCESTYRIVKKWYKNCLLTLRFPFALRKTNELKLLNWWIMQN